MRYLVTLRYDLQPNAVRILAEKSKLLDAVVEAGQRAKIHLGGWERDQKNPKRRGRADYPKPTVEVWSQVKEYTPKRVRQQPVSSRGELLGPERRK